MTFVRFKTIALFVVLCFNIGVTLQEETEIYALLPEISEETDLNLNQTVSQVDWSELVKHLGDEPEKKDAEEGEEVEIEDDITGKPRIIKRQIIKIPSGVTKVKVIAQKPGPQIRPKRMPPLNRVYGTYQRKRPPRRYSQKRPTREPEEGYEEPKSYKNRDLDGRRTKTHGKKSKVVVKEVTPEEFYNDEDDLPKLQGPHADNYQNPVKHTRKTQTRKPQRHHYYESSEEVVEERPGRRPSSVKEQVYEASSQESDYARPVKYHYDGRPGLSYSSPEYGRDPEEYAASSVQLKQVPAPNLAGLNLIDPPDMLKEAKPTTYRVPKETPVPTVEYTTKKSPSSRDIQSSFPHQYTSHNPYVMTNFGLDEKTKTKLYSYKHDFSDFDDKSIGSYVTGSSKYNLQVAAGSEPSAVTVPAGSNGLQVVQPPQFGATQTSVETLPGPTETSRANQRATIRDILQQDCPDYEMLGYCSSPPRYPTIQINNMALKCSELQDVMSSPVPPEPEDDLTSFSRRSDDDIDLIFENEGNDTKSYDFPEQSWPSWSRSGSDSETACESEYTIIEPGYAREVSTGRWFVIVQNSDSSLQKVTTDTCSSPGRPCGGLAGMKCSRNRGFNSGIKSTRCIQRYTHQRLISWDPEAPNKCPRIRVFRFPTACICHMKRM